MIRTQTAAALPSGLWTGHYRQHGMENPQRMTLEFADGLIRGTGTDQVGDFSIEGEYRVDEGTTRMGWIKSYDVAHSVLYLGTFDGDRIVGRWSAYERRGRFALHPARSGML